MNNYRYRCQLSNGVCPTPGTSNGAILTVNTLPAVSASPNDVTICVGSNNTFGVTASGTGITYQWQLSTDAGATYGNIAGATSSTYTVSGVTIGMNGNRYRCIVSGACSPTATSNAAILTVIAPVSITTQPASTAVCAGNNASFTIVGSSVQTIVYQWQVDPGTGFVNITNNATYSGANTATLSITGAVLIMNNYLYRCLLSNATCAVPTVSNNTTKLTVNALPVVTWANALAEQCSNNTTYALTGGTPAGGAYSGTGVTGSNFNASTAGAGTYTLTYTYTDANGCVNSTTKSITVRQQPTIGLTASKSALLPGNISTLTATPTTSGGTAAISWLYNGNALTNPNNTWSVDVEHVGTYQVGIQETWPSTLVCSNQSPIVTISATPSDNLFIFPSPNDGRFTVSYYNNGGASTKRTIAIFDSEGQLVFNGTFNITGAYTLIPIDLRTHNTGIDLVVVGDANGKKLATGKVHVR
jgi:hypothetical protein